MFNNACNSACKWRSEVVCEGAEQHRTGAVECGNDIYKAVMIYVYVGRSQRSYERRPVCEGQERSSDKNGMFSAGAICSEGACSVPKTTPLGNGNYK